MTDKDEKQSQLIGYKLVLFNPLYRTQKIFQFKTEKKIRKSASSDREKKIVIGYIEKINENDLAVPKLIVHLILCYNKPHDEFQHHPDCKLHDANYYRGSCISRSELSLQKNVVIVTGSKIIDADYYGQTIKWKIKIKKHHSENMIIGLKSIDRTNDFVPHLGVFWDTIRGDISYDLMCYKRYSKPVAIKADDIIVVLFDTKAMSAGFAYDEGGKGELAVYFTQTSTNINVRNQQLSVALSLNGKKDCVELVSFEVFGKRL